MIATDAKSIEISNVVVTITATKPPPLTAQTDGLIIPMQHETIAVLDYGSQYSQLICRRVRVEQVYAELIPWDRPMKCCPAPAQGLILSGGPNSVYAAGAPTLPESVLAQGVPVLGICYGLQLWPTRWVVRSPHRMNESMGPRPSPSPAITPARAIPFLPACPPPCRSG